MLILWTVGLIVSGGWCLSMLIALLFWERAIVSRREARQAGVSDFDSLQLLMPRSTLWLPLLSLIGAAVLLGWILMRIGLLEAVTVLVSLLVGIGFVSAILLPDRRQRYWGDRFLNTLYARRDSFIRSGDHFWEDLASELIDKLEEALGYSIQGRERNGGSGS
ncbi:hypothetical protein EVJ50_00925 [Synechococcus sp. RSCCF101]|uniref:hypothetical protein n=1 Tax=Synechococcus sp. RSCCF101 TaxID=2511069 RepID=UPI001247DC5F|nr:hypothetical protein [Synechococcus sp. RSCCF101]QEY31031.1 hypothetical protein EVJ50_00925 [Synechococcus sp. RSCCF101]